MHLVVLVLALLALVGIKPATNTTAPGLRLLKEEPIAVAGQGFRPRERVRLVALGSLERVSVRARADLRGAFKVSFPSLGPDRCAPLVLAAIGSNGSHASLKVMRRPCQPFRLPPRRR